MHVTVASDRYILLACDKVYRLRLYSTDKRTRCAFAGVLRHVDLWIASYLLLNWHFEELIIQDFVLC